jgi:hypothetical protein
MLRVVGLCKVANSSISNPESEIPEVAQLEQPLKTSKNLKSWTLGNVGPFCWKLT